MKLYKIKLKAEIMPFYVYPFSFVAEWRNAIQFEILQYRLKNHFIKLAWTHDDIMLKTLYCGSLREATRTLSNILLDDFGWTSTDLYSVAWKLVDDGFERRWK